MGAVWQGGETRLFTETLSTVLLGLRMEQYKDNKEIPLGCLGLSYSIITWQEAAKN